MIALVHSNALFGWLRRSRPAHQLRFNFIPLLVLIQVDTKGHLPHVEADELSVVSQK